MTITKSLLYSVSTSIITIVRHGLLESRIATRRLRVNYWPPIYANLDSLLSRKQFVHKLHKSLFVSYSVALQKLAQLECSGSCQFNLPFVEYFISSCVRIADCNKIIVNIPHVRYSTSHRTRLSACCCCWWMISVEHCTGHRYHLHMFSVVCVDGFWLYIEKHWRCNVDVTCATDI